METVASETEKKKQYVQGITEPEFYSQEEYC